MKQERRPSAGKQKRARATQGSGRSRRGADTKPLDAFAALVDGELQTRLEPDGEVSCAVAGAFNELAAKLQAVTREFAGVARVSTA